LAQVCEVAPQSKVVQSLHCLEGKGMQSSSTTSIGDGSNISDKLRSAGTSSTVSETNGKHKQVDFTAGGNGGRVSSQSTIQGGSSISLGSSAENGGRVSKKQSNQSKAQKRRQTLRQVAIFANNIAMDDDEELKSGEIDNDLPQHIDNAADEHVNETGTERLQRALTTEEKHKGLFRYTNTLGSAVGIEPDVLMRVALEDEWQMVSCASLPFTIVFFVIFMLFFQLHYGVTDIFLAEASFRSKLAVPATEITEAVQIYDWLENDYFPFLWAAKKDANNQVQLNSESLYQDIVAGVRLTTTRAKKQKCEDEIVNYMDCYSAYDNVKMSGNGVFGTPAFGSPGALPSLLANSGGRRMEEPSKQGIDADGGGVQMEAQKRKAVENESELPIWARPGMSEGFKNYQKSKGQELFSAPRPKRRTAEAHDWRSTDSLVSKAVPASAVDPPAAASLIPGRRKKRSDRNKLLQDGWHHGRRFSGNSEVSTSQSPQSQQARRLMVNRPEIRGMTPRLHEGNMSEVIIPISWTLAEVTAELQRWRQIRVIQDTTLTFGAQALVMNKNLGHDLLSSVVFDFSIHRGGNVFAEAKLMSVVLTEVFSSAAQTCLGISWVLCLLAFSMMLPSRAYLRWKQGRLRSHVWRFWNLIEWGIISWGWLVLGIFIVERAMIRGIKADIEDYRLMREGLSPAQWYALDTNAVRDLLGTASTMIDLSMWSQMIVALFHIILVCRFFLASRGQPRLAVVLSTIRKASVDLLHLLIVFMIIFIAYAVSGHILFGRRLQEFATFQGAFARCFQIVMEREYTWRQFTEEDLWTATIWVWSFLLLVVLVLVNIFLAMIFDTYGDVRSSVGHSATLWQTTKIVATHLRHTFSLGSESSKWIPNRELVQAVRAMQCQYVTPWMVKDAFPGISNRQVNYIFNLGKNRLENMLLRGNKSSLPAVIASILLGIERMHQGLQMMETNSTKKVAEARKERGVGQPVVKGKAQQQGSTPMPDVGNAVAPPEEPPAWLKVQLMPHFHKQRNLLTQVHVQIQRIEKTMHLRGQSADIPPPPGSTPRNVNVAGALAAPGATLPPCGPSNAGMVPAAMRSGLTASGEDSPKSAHTPKSFSQPGG